MKLAFVCGLSEKKLAQKLLPLQVLDQVDEIHLYRRLPYHGKKIHWMTLPRWAQKSRVIGDFFRFFRLLLYGGRYDVIIGCHQIYHGLMAYICGKIWKKPVVQLVIEDVDWITSRPLLRLAMLKANACAVRGPISYAKLRSWGYNDRIDILENPFTVPQNVPEYSVSNKQYDFVAVGDLAKKKEYPWMMCVLAEVKKEWPELKVAIVGSGAFEQKLGYLLSNYELSQNVEFLGWKDNTGLDAVYKKVKPFCLLRVQKGCLWLFWKQCHTGFLYL